MPSRPRQHQADLVSLSRLLRLELRGLWPNLLLLGLPQLAAVVAALLRPYTLAATALAAEFYEAERREAGLTDRFTVPLVEPAPVEQVQATMSWATRKLRSSRDAQTFDLPADVLRDPTTARSRPEATAPAEQVPARRRARVVSGDEASGSRPRRRARLVGDADVDPVELALEKASSAAQKLMTDPARETVARAVDEDPGATRWMRVPTGETTCFFCALMCTRGATFLSRESAGANVSRNFVGAGEFMFHNGCDCIAIPVFTDRPRDIDAATRKLLMDWEHLYETSTRGVYGKEKLREFRRHFEGRANRV